MSGVGYYTVRHQGIGTPTWVASRRRNSPGKTPSSIELYHENRADSDLFSVASQIGVRGKHVAPEATPGEHRPDWQFRERTRISVNAVISPLILASGSPRRRALLAELGLPFRVVISDVPEDTDPDLPPEIQAIVLAERKAHAVASKLESGIVIGADTIVSLDSEMLGKPANDADAIRMLRRLSGREHDVVTGIAVIDAATGSSFLSAVNSVVRMRTLSDGEIRRYVATEEPRDKAGAYAIQGHAAEFVSKLDGCFTNVVGLPLCETAQMLRDAGVMTTGAWRGCHLPDGAPCPRQD